MQTITKPVVLSLIQDSCSMKACNMHRVIHKAQCARRTATLLLKLWKVRECLLLVGIAKLPTGRSYIQPPSYPDGH